MTLALNVRTFCLIEVINNLHCYTTYSTIHTYHTRACDVCVSKNILYIYKYILSVITWILFINFKYVPKLSSHLQYLFTFIFQSGLECTMFVTLGKRN